MRLAYIQPYNLTFLQPWFILETILLVLNVFIYVVWLIIMAKAHLHINLKVGSQQNITTEALDTLKCVEMCRIWKKSKLS